MPLRAASSQLMNLISLIKRRKRSRDVDGICSRAGSPLESLAQWLLVSFSLILEIVLFFSKRTADATNEWPLLFALVHSRARARARGRFRHFCRKPCGAHSGRSLKRFRHRHTRTGERCHLTFPRDGEKKNKKKNKSCHRVTPCWPDAREAPGLGAGLFAARGRRERASPTAMLDDRRS